VTNYLLYALGIYLLCVNLWAFILMGVDKRRAKKDKWRIRERTLLLAAWLMGGIGAWAGMRVFRHKTKHLAFQVSVPLAAILQILLFIGLGHKAAGLI